MFKYFTNFLFNCIIKEYIAVNSKTEIPVLLDNLINRPNITLDEIAAATHYSKRHISRLIKQQYGVSFSVLRKNIWKVSLWKVKYKSYHPSKSWHFLSLSTLFSAHFSSDCILLMCCHCLFPLSLCFCSREWIVMPF